METRVKTADEKFCSECGEVIRARAEICPKCGVRQMLPGRSGGPSRIVAAMLALFLGGIGIHKLYMGYVFQGIMYMLFCWTFIPLILSLIEALIYFSVSDGTFRARYAE